PLLYLHSLPTRRSSDLFVFEGFQFRRNEALGIFEGLAPDIVGRCLVRMDPAELNEVAMHLVVAHLQGGNAGTLPLPLLYIDQELDRKSTRLNSSHVKIS